jgi:SPX domain protein involved in polyphosphate accumulation
MPSAVMVQRKVYKEGWRPEAAVKDSFPLQESKVCDFLLGRLTFAQAHKYMKEQQEQLSAILKLSESDGVALEYKLFKTYTEIQRLIEVKKLQPMVRVVHREEVYEQVAGMGGSATAGVKVEVEIDIEALLEYR